MALETLVQKYNKDNSKALVKIEKIVADNIKAISNAQKAMLKISANNINKIKDFQKDVAAHKAVLDEWFPKLECLVKNKRAAYYIMLRNKAAEECEKFVSAPVEKESDLAVADERRLRDKLKGSLESATEIIRTCRNIMNNYEGDS